MLKLGRRDYTGRSPRASSRGAAFYQSYTEYATPQNGPQRPIDEPSVKGQYPHNVEPQVDDRARGGGY